MLGSRTPSRWTDRPPGSGTIAGRRRCSSSMISILWDPVVGCAFLADFVPLCGKFHRTTLLTRLSIWRNGRRILPVPSGDPPALFARKVEHGKTHLPHGWSRHACTQKRPSRETSGRVLNPSEPRIVPSCSGKRVNGEGHRMKNIVIFLRKERSKFITACVGLKGKLTIQV